MYNDDPRYLSGELVSLSKNKINAYDTINKKYIRVNKDDHRFITGELIKKSAPRKRKSIMII